MRNGLYFTAVALGLGMPAAAQPQDEIRVNPSQAQIHLVGYAEMLPHRLRLTPAEKQVAGAAWFTEKQHVIGGFEMKVRFEISETGGLGPGADGFAFVLQNSGTNVLAGRGSAGGWSIGDGRGDWSMPGIPRSIAVFFDTYRNRDGNDPSGNYVALCTNGQIGSMKWPPLRLATGTKLRVRLKDGKPHEARIVYKPPLVSVYLDEGEPEFRVPADLSTIVDEAGDAYIGFTASTGNGYENHDLLDFSFKPIRTAAASEMSMVQSQLTFLPGNCLPDHNLCTPKEAIVEQRGPNRYSIILPAHREWAASIPNPDNRPIAVSESKGLVCFDLTGNGVYECSGPDGMEESSADARKRAVFVSADHQPGALIAETKGGRTNFSVNIRKGRASKRNQGFFDFEVELK